MTFPLVHTPWQPKEENPVHEAMQYMRNLEVGETHTFHRSLWHSYPKAVEEANAAGNGRHYEIVDFGRKVKRTA